MVRSLREGGIVWYAPDQSYNRKGSVIVHSFFRNPHDAHDCYINIGAPGQRCGRTVFALARLENGSVLCCRDARPHLTEFPSGDPVEDTLRYVRICSRSKIREFPEQYFWIHRKFKNLPDDYPDYYADLDAVEITFEQLLPVGDPEIRCADPA